MDAEQSQSGIPPAVRLDPGPSATLVLSGDWAAPQHAPELPAELAGATALRLDATAVGDWDSTLVVFLLRVIRDAEGRGSPPDLSGLPAGVRSLLELALAVPERTGARRDAGHPSVLTRVGEMALGSYAEGHRTLAFIGEVVLSLTRFVRYRAQCRRQDVLEVVRDCGPSALGIVSLISLLVGLILAFVGAVQLRMFGAEIYVADLVGIGIVREMGAIMAGIVMAGRTGSSFAARIGTMQVNEEIDALRTMGISPIDFLVLPRVIGLTVMMPLLCLYADFMGMLGGLIVGVTMLDLNATQYVLQTRQAVGMNDLLIGVVMSIVFGLLVSTAGCMRGMQCGRSSGEVGKATTSAVVTSIVAIIVATAIITVVCDIIGV